MHKHEIDPDELHRLLHLDEETGRLFWKMRGSELFAGGSSGGQAAEARSWNRTNAGKEAFLQIDRYGYRQGRLFGKARTAHRIIFAMHYRRWVKSVDHINGDRLDNRPVNLREATGTQQNMNSRGYGGTSQYCGVSRQDNAWIAMCTNQFRKQVYLGRFKSEIEAARAYDKAAREWHGEFARLNGA